MVARTRLNLSLYVHCLSCRSYLSNGSNYFPYTVTQRNARIKSNCRQHYNRNLLMPIITVFQHTILVPNRSTVSCTLNVSAVSCNSVYGAKRILKATSQHTCTHDHHTTLGSLKNRIVLTPGVKNISKLPHHRSSHLLNEVSANFTTTSQAWKRNYMLENIRLRIKVRDWVVESTFFSKRDNYWISLRKAQNNDWHITIVSSFRWFGAGGGVPVVCARPDQTAQSAVAWGIGTSRK